ncbi:Muramoyltetrapeptide carboxypeptidase [hydrothermal vent metagenome]|uniref:Muramoyltetrapeptide carboxypeptidase n=1 Tax=hydrothermal vent metagenome TaxID=652676 RepID=A0A3B0SJE2_9ZZZZ
MSQETKHIALVCPGGPIDRGLADQTCALAAARFGERAALHFHPQCFLEAGHFAGDDAARSDAFLEVANDPKFDAVWFARGGYGACRLADSVFTKLNAAARVKTYLGYSDAGMILARLYEAGIGRPVHGPMPTDLARPNGAQAIERALDFLIAGAADTLEPTAQSGAKTVAFNITVLSHLIAADWAPDLSGHVVLLEDVSEYLYCIDRAMFAIASSPKLRHAAGIKLGRISDVPENDRPFGHSEEDIFAYWCARTGVAYLGRADIGHDAENKVVPFGVS